MPHTRTTVRDAIKAALIGEDEENPGVYATAAGARVYGNRANPWSTGELPALNVSTQDETVELVSDAPRILDRTLQVVIEGVVRASGDTDDTADDLLAEVETAMHADRFFGGAVDDSLMTDVEAGVKVEGSQKIAWFAVTYAVKYHTNAYAEVELTPLTEVHTEYNLSGEQDEDDDSETTQELEGGTP